MPSRAALMPCCHQMACTPHGCKNDCLGTGAVCKGESLSELDKQWSERGPPQQSQCNAAFCEGACSSCFGSAFTETGSHRVQVGAGEGGLQASRHSVDHHGQRNEPAQQSHTDVSDASAEAKVALLLPLGRISKMRAAKWQTHRQHPEMDMREATL